MIGCLPEIADRVVRSQCSLTGIQFGKNKLDVLMLLNLSNEESWRLINLQRHDKSEMTKPMSSGYRADRRQGSKEQSTHKKWRTIKSDQRNHFYEDVYKM